MQVDNTTYTQVPDSVESRVRGYMTEHFEIDFSGQVDEKTDLFEQGLVDSFGFVELVKFLEKEFEIRFSDEELFSYQLNTLTNITDMVTKKLNSR